MAYFQIQISAHAMTASAKRDLVTWAGDSMITPRISAICSSRFWAGLAFQQVAVAPHANPRGADVIFRWQSRSNSKRRFFATVERSNSNRNRPALVVADLALRTGPQQLNYPLLIGHAAYVR